LLSQPIVAATGRFIATHALYLVAANTQSRLPLDPSPGPRVIVLEINHSVACRVVSVYVNDTKPLAAGRRFTGGL